MKLKMEKKLNDLYVSVEKWYKKQNPEFVKEFTNVDDYWYDKSDFQKLLYWYEETKQLPAKVRDYFLGKKEITFDILQKYLSTENDYEVINDKDLIKLASGNLDDDIYIDDLDYSLRITHSLPMIFAYLYYKLNWDKDEFNEHLYNSLQYTEELEDLFIIYTMPSDDEIEKIIEKKVNSHKIQNESDFVNQIKIVIREFEYKKGFEDRISILKQLINQ